jgi:hypothetical protein
MPFRSWATGERWTVFSLGRGYRPSQAYKHEFIDGDLGLAGTGNFLMRGHAIVDGDVYDWSTGLILAFKHPVITGLIFHDQDALLDDCVDEVLAASAYTSSLEPNRSNASVKIRGHHNITITGAPSETVVLSRKISFLRGTVPLPSKGQRLPRSSSMFAKKSR